MKNDLRFIYKKIRDNCKDSVLDNYIFDNIINLDEFKNCSDVSIYYSINSEVDTLKLIDFCLKNNKRVFLPRCIDNMDFYLINDLNEIKIGKFNIMESISNVNDYNNSICITPGICFDKYFYRIGYGLGYYDKFFHNYNGIKIGICYDKCLIDNCFHDEYDVPVDIIVTEKKILKRFKKFS